MNGVAAGARNMVKGAAGAVMHTHLTLVISPCKTSIACFSYLVACCSTARSCFTVSGGAPNFSTACTALIIALKLPSTSSWAGDFSFAPRQ